MSKKKIYITLIGILSLLLVGAIIWLSWSGSPKDIVAVANQFKPDSTWELKEDRVTPPRTVCLDSVCPEVARSWITKKNVTKDDFQKMLVRAGWNKVKIEDAGCSQNLVGCSAAGNVGQYMVQVYVQDSDNIYGKPSLSLFIRK